MIQMQFCGQWGNQLFQYVLAKILAERTGLAYQPPPEFCRKDGQPVSWSGPPLFRMTPTPGRVLQADPADWQIIDATHWVDLDEIKGDRPVLLRGFFQRYSLYQPWKDQIKNDWLRIPPERFAETDPEAVVIHVRRTDYVDIGGGKAPDTTRQERATTEDEFARCLQEFPDARRLVLVSDDPNAAAAMKWPLPFTIAGAPWDRDFLTLASARQLIISCSTFSWWAGWLGRAAKIVTPVFDGTYWARGIGAAGPDRPLIPNLYPDDEAGRWVWLTE